MRNVANSKIRKQWITKIDEFKNTERLAQQKLIQISNQLYQDSFEYDHFLIKNQIKIPNSTTNFELYNNKSNTTFPSNNTIQLYQIKQKNDRLRSRQLPRTISNSVNNIDINSENDGTSRIFSRTTKANYLKPKTSFTNFVIFDDRDKIENQNTVKKKCYRSRKNKTLYTKLLFYQNKQKQDNSLFAELQNKIKSNKKNYNSVFSKIEQPKMMMEVMMQSLYNSNKNGPQFLIKLPRK